MIQRALFNYENKIMKYIDDNKIYRASYYVMWYSSRVEKKY